MWGKQECSGIAHRPINGLLITSTWGYGSVATKIPNFTTPSNITGVCPGLIFSTDSVNGCKFVCQEQGTYCFSWSISLSSGDYYGFTLNSTQLTTDVESLTDKSVLAFAITSTTNSPSHLSTTIPLLPGDIVRPHTAGSTAGALTTYLRACRSS